MPESSERQSLVTVAGIDGYFATCSGGNSPADTSEAWNGGDLSPAVVAGPPKPDNVTVTKPFVPERDSALIARLRKLIGIWRTTVSDQSTDAGLVPLGDATVWTDALLIDVQKPDADAGSGNPKKWGLVFKPSRVL